jgi:hypothetical protein
VIEGVGLGEAAGHGPPRAPVWRPEQLTASWLTEVFRHAGVLDEASVLDVAIEPVGTGQMADSMRLRLRYDAEVEEAPVSVVGKFTAADETSRTTGVAMRTSEVEVRFYQEVASTVGVRTARCYYADVDPATARFVLILEDLAPARAGDQLTGCSVDEAALAVSALAALHAPRWGDPNLEALEWLNRRSGAGDEVTAQVLPELFRGFVARYGDVLDEAVLDVGRRFMPRIGAYLRHRPGARTVQHADFRLDNLLFGTGATAADRVAGGGATGDGASVAVVDWQSVVLGPGAADVSYFLGAGPSVESRRRCERDLVARYHEDLVAGGVRHYSFDECFTDYRRYAYAGYLMAVGASMMVQRTARGDDMFLAMVRRHAAQIVDLDAERLIAP